MNKGPGLPPRRNFNLSARGKIPPQAVDLEEAVLGAIMIDLRGLNEVIDILSSEMFYKPEHASIYESIVNLFNKGNPIDLMTISDELKTIKKLDFVGGEFYLIQLTQKISSSAHIDFHARIIIQKYVQRRLIALSEETMDKAYNNDSDIFDLLNNIDVNLMDIENMAIKNKDINNDDIVANAEKRYERASQGLTVGLEVGIDDYDEFTSGLQPSELTIIAARPGMGKLQPYSEPILTPNGWKIMGNIKKGSDVICPVSGKEIKVLEVFPKKNLDIYKVSFSDGTFSECCNDHLWKIQTHTDIKNNKWRIVDVNWMLETGVLDTRNKSRFRIPLTNPIDFKTKEVKIHPYLLGLFIGNGYISSKNQVTITNHSDVSKEIFDRIKNLLPEDVTIRLDKQYGELRARKICFSSSIRKYFDELGLLDKKSREKFIPQNYLFNSLKIRKELLKGLMDSDGSCLVYKTKKKATYSTMSIELKNNIIELIRSLGGVATASSEKRDKYKNNGICWNVWLRIPFNPFHLSYKKEKFNSVGYKQTFTKTIRSIKFIRKDEGQCILVDSKEHLYVTRDYTVTHNTTLALIIAYNLAILKGYSGVFFSIEMPKRQLYNKLISKITGIAYFNIKTMKLSKDQFNQVIQLYKWFENESPLKIVDSVSTIPGINKWIKDNKPEWFMVDYLQIMSTDSSISKKGGNREQEVSYFSRNLKAMAKKYDIPAIALSQLSRAVDKTAHHRPRLSDLRESGAIEQDADNVIFIIREAYYSVELGKHIPEIEKGNTIMDIAKGRDTGVKVLRIHIDMVGLKVENYFLYNDDVDVFNDGPGLPPTLS